MRNRRPALPRPDANPIRIASNKQISLTEKAYELRKYEHQTSRPMKLKQTFKWRRARASLNAIGMQNRDDRLRRHRGENNNNVMFALGRTLCHGFYAK